MIGYHVTTLKKLSRYSDTGCIFEPVRFWSNLSTAIAWAKRTGRRVILRIDAATAYPLPDHKPRGMAYWTDKNIKQWSRIDYA